MLKTSENQRKEELIFLFESLKKSSLSTIQVVQLENESKENDVIILAVELKLRYSVQIPEMIFKSKKIILKK